MLIDARGTELEYEMFVECLFDTDYMFMSSLDVVIVSFLKWKRR